MVTFNGSDINGANVTSLLANSLWLGSLTSEPADLVDGYVWYRSDLNKLRARINGVTNDLLTNLNGYLQSVVLPAESSFVDVTLNTSYSDTDYAILPENQFQTSTWITNKTTTAFRLNFGATYGYVITILFKVEHA
jgi:hypothetical protein